MQNYSPLKEMALFNDLETHIKLSGFEEKPLRNNSHPA